MQVGQAVLASDPALLIVDRSDKKVESMVHLVHSHCDMYTFNMNVLDISEWKKQDQEKECTKIAFLVSIDTDKLYSRIKDKLINETCSPMLLILTCENDMSKVAESIVKDVHKKRSKRRLSANNNNKKNANKGNVKDNLSMVKVALDGNSDIAEKISTWFPHLLYLISGNQTYKTKMEVGVFYKIDPDDRTQYEWYESQRRILETHFRIKCAYSCPDECEDDLYVRNSDCLVLYVPQSTIKSLNSLDPDQKELIKLASTVSCNTLMFCEQVHTSFEFMVARCYEMRRVGEGTSVRWIELFSTLGLINARRRRDWTFYSHQAEDNHRARHIDQPQRALSVSTLIVGPIDADTARRSPTSARQNHVKEAIFRRDDQYGIEASVDVVNDGQTKRTTCMPWACLFSRNPT